MLQFKRGELVRAQAMHIMSLMCPLCPTRKQLRHDLLLHAYMFISWKVEIVKMCVVKEI